MRLAPEGGGVAKAVNGDGGLGLLERALFVNSLVRNGRVRRQTASRHHVVVRIFSVATASTSTLAVVVV